jgi:hypothetical protein
LAIDASAVYNSWEALNGCGKAPSEGNKGERHKKHAITITKNKPAAAILCGEDHPDLKASLEGFLDDPIGTIELHLNKEDDDMVA